MIGLACLSTHDSGFQLLGARMRRARGEGDPRGRVTALALAFSPDGTTIATIHSDAARGAAGPSDGPGPPRFLGNRGYACAPRLLPRWPCTWVLGDPRTRHHLVRPRDRGSGRSLEDADRKYHHPGVLVGRPDPRGCVPPERGPIPPLGRGRAAGKRAHWRGHSSPVLSLAFAPDGRSLASGGGIGDQAIIVWDLATGGQRLRLVTPGFVTALAYSPDGSLLASVNCFPGGPGSASGTPAAGRLVQLDRQSLHLPEFDGLRPGRPAAGTDGRRRRRR